MQDESDSHSCDGSQEKSTATDSVDEGSGEESPCQVPDLKDTVDEELDSGVQDTDSLEDLGEVVRDETISGPLREKGKSDDNSHASPVSWGGEKGLPADLRFDFTIELDGSLDFVEFISNKTVIFVAVSMVVCECFQSLCIASLLDQPTGRLGNEENE